MSNKETSRGDAWIWIRFIEFNGDTENFWLTSSMKTQQKLISYEFTAKTSFLED